MSFERAMTTPSTISSNSLPPLHQAIPEFHSHNPHERRSSSVPRRLVERGSPSFRHPQRLSPGASSVIADTGSMNEFSPYYLDSDFSMPKSFYPDLFLTDGMAVPLSNEPTEGVYDAQMYMFPGHLDSSRRTGGHMASNSVLPLANPRSSSYLPPVSSLSSRDPAERQVGGAAPLPLLYNSHHQPNQPTYMSSYEHDMMRSQQTTPDYPRYSSAPIMSSTPYQSSSPGAQYSQPNYYSHSGAYAQPPRPQTAYSARHPVPADARSPFSPPVHPGELGMGHSERGRPGGRRRGNLPKQVTDLLRNWLNKHLHHPYPTEDEKQMLMSQTGLTIHQISNWFINARRRRVPAITNADSRASGSKRTSATQ